MALAAEKERKLVTSIPLVEPADDDNGSTTEAVDQEASAGTTSSTLDTLFRGGGDGGANE